MKSMGDLYIEDAERSIQESGLPCQIVLKRIISFVLETGFPDTRERYSWNNILDILYKRLIREYSLEWQVGKNVLYKWKLPTETTKIIHNEQKYLKHKGIVPDDCLTYLSKELMKEAPVHPLTEPTYEYIIRNLPVFLDIQRCSDPLMEDIQNTYKKHPVYSPKLAELIERNISYFYGYPEFLKTCLNIVSEWIWWKSITGFPDWREIKLLNSIDYKCGPEQDRLTGTLLGITHVHLDMGNNNRPRTSLYHWVILENSLPVLLKIPGIRSNLLKNPRLKKISLEMESLCPGDQLLVSGELIPGDAVYLYGVGFIHMRIKHIERK